MPGGEIPSGRCWEVFCSSPRAWCWHPSPLELVCSVREWTRQHLYPETACTSLALSRSLRSLSLPQPWHGGLCHQEHRSLPGSPGISCPITGHSSAVGLQGASAQPLDTQGGHGGFVLGAEKGSERRRVELTRGDG